MDLYVPWADTPGEDAKGAGAADSEDLKEVEIFMGKKSADGDKHEHVESEEEEVANANGRGFEVFASMIFGRCLRKAGNVLPIDARVALGAVKGAMLAGADVGA